MGAVVVTRPGLLTTVQDLGRWGFQSFGVSVAGPMDPWSHRLANALVGNPANAPALEITIQGPELVFEDARRIAVTGAEFSLALDGRLLRKDTVVHVPAGATLTFSERRSGARAYLAVAGGFDVPRVFGSASTHLASGLGGFHGRALAAGDRLPLGPATFDARANERSHDGLSALTATALEGPPRVRVLPGPQADRFLTYAFDVFQAQPYRVSVTSDRMAFRLEGPRVEHVSRESADIISEATMAGAIQVPASGEPIVLMADRQTTGGYAKIAGVIEADIGVLGQLAPGDFVRFELCDERTALTALIARERAVMDIEAHAAS